VVEPESPAAIVDGILQLRALGDEQLRGLGERGRAYLESHFAYDVLVEQWIALLEQDGQ
jgi:glycosyltransferase involved in cell wall biosynthesis